MRTTGSNEKDTKTNPYEHNRRTTGNQPAQNKEKDRGVTENEYKREDNEALSKENSFGTGREFAMALDNKMKHEEESKSVHVEDWENDPYTNARRNEDDVRSELAVRRNGTSGRNGRGNDYMDEGQRWRNYAAEHSTDDKRGNGNRKSGNTTLND
jgi:hypothetical protein